MPVSQRSDELLDTLRQHTTHHITKNQTSANQALRSIRKLSYNCRQKQQDSLFALMTSTDLHHLAQSTASAHNDDTVLDALHVIGNLCRQHSAFQKAIHEHGGLSPIITLIKKSKNPTVQKIALKTLSRLAENNADVQQAIYQSKMPSRLLKQLFIDKGTHLPSWILHLFNRILHNNPSNQKLFTDNNDIKYLMLWLAQPQQADNNYTTSQAICIINQIARGIANSSDAIVEYGGIRFFLAALSNYPKDSDQYTLALDTLSCLLNNNPAHQQAFCKQSGFRQLISKLETMPPSQFHHAPELELIHALAKGAPSNLIALNAAIDNTINHAAARRQTVGLNLHNWLATHYPEQQANHLKERGIQHISTHLLIHKQFNSSAYNLALQAGSDLCQNSIENRMNFCHSRAFTAIVRQLNKLPPKTFNRSAEKILLENLAKNNRQAQKAINAAISNCWHKDVPGNLIPYIIEYPRQSFHHLDNQPEKIGSSASSSHIRKNDDKSLWFAKAGSIAHRTNAYHEALLENIINAFYQELCGPSSVATMALAQLENHVTPCFGAAGVNYHRTSTHSLSKIIPDFTPLGCIPHFNNKNKPAFTLDRAEQGPLEVIGFGSALAVAAVFNDLDFLGGSGCNAGTKAVTGLDGRTRLQFLKIDHGFALRPTATNPIAARDFQVATSAADKIINYDQLPVNVRHEFLKTLQRFIMMPKDRIQAFFVQPNNTATQPLSERAIKRHTDLINTRLTQLQQTYRLELASIAHRSARQHLPKQARAGIFTCKHQHARWRPTLSLSLTEEPNIHVASL